MPGFNREKAQEQAAKAGGTGRKMCFICSKGSLDMAYPALIMGNAALAQGHEVELFFTFWGMDIITKKKQGKLHVATVGNPNMHPMMHFPTLIGALPGMSALASAMMRKTIADLDVPPVPEFLDMMHEAGAKVYACLMSVDMMKLKKEDMVDYAEILDANEFIERSEGAQVIFI